MAEVEAIAAGKRAAVMIDRYLCGEEFHQPAVARLPRVLVEPDDTSTETAEAAERVVQPGIPVEARKHSFAEVEGSLAEEEAIRETRRCLRCDLEFTRPTAESVDCERVDADVV